MHISLPPCDTQRRVVARSVDWSWDSIVDDSHPHIDIPLPDGIDERNVEVFAYAVLHTGERDPKHKSVVLKMRNRKR